MQVDVCCGLREVGVQVRPVTNKGATSEKLADVDDPFREAVTVAAPLAVNEPAATLNVIPPVPAGTVTLVGAVMLPLVASATGWPPLGAFPLRVAVQLEVCWGPSEVGVHVTPVTNRGATSERLAVVDVPFREAVMMAVPSAVNEPAAMLKARLPAPAGTVTLAGAVMLPLVASATAWPPEGAFPLSVTVHVDGCWGLRDVGVQVRPVTKSGATSERFTDEDVPFRETVRVAVALAVNEPAAMVKARLPVPAGTVMLVGAVMLPVVVSASACPPVGAFPLSVTVHVDVC